MFILIFATITFVAITTQNIFLIWLTTILLCTILVLLKNKLDFKRYIIYTLISFFLVILSVSTRLTNYNKSIPTEHTKVYAGTWQITDIYSVWRFLFADPNWREYFLYSDKSYKIWDLILLDAWVSLAYEKKTEISIKSQRNDFVSFSFLPTTLSYEFDFSKRLMMKWMYGSLYEKNSVKIGDFKLNIIQKTRASLQSLVLSTYGENQISGLILWMLIGDKSQIPKDEYDKFIDSWLVHIIAVSGWNIIMIVVFLNFVLFFVPLYARNIIILSVIVFYSLVCWLDSSVFRAMIMGWLSIVALLAWRDINIWRIMWIAFVAMLVWNPYFLLYDVWFLLSFSAIIWLIYFHKYINKDWKSVAEQTYEKSGKEKNPKKKTDFKKLTKDYISPTVWATLWVLPVMVFFMGSMNLAGILANFIVLPVVPFVMIYWFISLFLFKLFSREWILWIEEILIQYIYRVSDVVSIYWVYVQVDFWWFKYLLLVCFLVRFIRKRLVLKE